MDHFDTFLDAARRVFIRFWSPVNGYGPPHDDTHAETWSHDGRQELRSGRSKMCQKPDFGQFFAILLSTTKRPPRTPLLPGSRWCARRVVARGTRWDHRRRRICSASMSKSHFCCFSWLAKNAVFDTVRTLLWMWTCSGYWSICTHSRHGVCALTTASTRKIALRTHERVIHVSEIGFFCWKWVFAVADELVVGAKFERLLEWKSMVDRTSEQGFSLVARAWTIHFVCMCVWKGGCDLDKVWWV